MESIKLMSKENNIKLAEFNLKNISSWIEIADKKAGYFLTIALALFSVSFTILPKVSANIRSYFSEGSTLLLLLGIVLVLIFLAYFILAILGIRRLVRVITPRLIPKTCRKSVLFYETIKDMELENFKRNIQEMSDERIVDELSDQAYNNATVASEKYRDIRKAITLLKWGSLFAILFLVIVCIG